MSKILIIAEKPSVATDLAKVLSKELGKFEKKGKDRNTYFESDQAIIASAVGHLVELKMPSGPNGKKLPWGIKHLPVIPEKFEIQPIAKSESRLNLLKRLIKRKEVDERIELDDAQVLTILDKMVKQRRDSIKQFEDAGRDAAVSMAVAMPQSSCPRPR